MKTENSESKWTLAGREQAAPAPVRRPYEAPRIESGEAFEKVHLASNCNRFDPIDGCNIIC